LVKKWYLLTAVLSVGDPVGALVSFELFFANFEILVFEGMARSSGAWSGAVHFTQWVDNNVLGQASSLFLIQGGFPFGNGVVTSPVC